MLVRVHISPPSEFLQNSNLKAFLWLKKLRSHIQTLLGNMHVKSVALTVLELLLTAPLRTDTSRRHTSNESNISAIHSVHLAEIKMTTNLCHSVSTVWWVEESCLYFPTERLQSAVNSQTDEDSAIQARGAIDMQLSSWVSFFQIFTVKR